MNIRKSAVLVGLGVMAMSIAQTPTPIASSFGQGVIVNQNQVRAEFDYEVVKFLAASANEPTVRGRLEFVAPAPHNSGRIRIETRRLMNLGVNNNVAEFAGPASIVRPSPNGPVRVEGRVIVRVEDRWNPTPNTTPDPNRPKDRFHIRFALPAATPGGTPNVVFEFGGEVVRGNLVVRANNSGG